MTIEFDSQPGLVDIGVQWVASGVLEWVSRLFYYDLPRNSGYETMINEASLIPPGTNGVTMIPELFSGGFSNKPGEIKGFTHETTRAHIYRAALEALSYYTRIGLTGLQRAANCKVKDVICVGGGSKNALWNQIRADVLGIPVKVVDIPETTSLGAAMTTFMALGIYNSIDEARGALKFNTERSGIEYLPGNDHKRYQELYLEYIESNLF